MLECHVCVTQSEGHPGKFIETKVANHERGVLLQFWGHADLPKSTLEIHGGEVCSSGHALQHLLYPGERVQIFLCPCVETSKINAQNQRDPSFFHTSTTALHQGDWLGQIAPASSMSLSDAQTSSSKGGGMCLKHSLKGSSSLRQISCLMALVHPSSSGSSAKRCHGRRRVTPFTMAALWGDHSLRPLRFSLSINFSCSSCTDIHSLGTCTSSTCP